MRAVIAVRDINFYAFHGCLEEEAKIGGNYTVHVALTVDISGVMKSDELASTADYCLVYDIVKREMAIRSKLIEHAALRILHALTEEVPGVQAAEVEVVKHRPPVDGDVGKVSVIVKK